MARRRHGARSRTCSHARERSATTRRWSDGRCRIRGGSLGAAHWRPSVTFEQTRGDTLGEALLSQWASLVPPVNLRRQLSERVAELTRLAIRSASDDRFGLVFLHLPVPQPPGIYD